MKYFITITLLVSTSCMNLSPMNLAPLETRELLKDNPTSYDFNFSLTEVKKAIVTAFDIKSQIDSEFYKALGIKWEHGTVRIRMESREHAVFGEHIFQNSENLDDFYLHTSGEPLFSMTYFARGQPLAYRAKWHLHLVPINKDRTRITVITESPVVIKGTASLGPHGPVAKEIGVKPTTIEEYKLLLYIGHALGEKGMPALLLPEVKKQTAP